MMQLILHTVYTVLGYALYPIIFLIFMVRLLFDRKNSKYYLSRLGFLDMKPNNKGQTVWIHAKNEFEVTSIKSIVEIMLEHQYNIYISTNIKGYKRANILYNDEVNIFYMPICNNLIAAKLIDNIGAEYVVISNLSVSPNLIFNIYKKSIPIYLLNADVNNKYMWIFYCLSFFMKQCWNMYKKVFAQTESDLKDLVKIGFSEDRITIMGNTKYDININIIEEKYEAISNLIPKNKFIIVVSKTHAEEESNILKSIKEANLGDNIYLILCPYDINRTNEVYDLAKEHGYDVSLYTNRLNIGKDAMVINVSQDIIYWYKKCDIAIIGGSFLRDVGGHDILEPIHFAKPVIVGQYMHSFQKIYEYLKDTIITCKTYEELSMAIKNLHDDRNAMNMLGNCALMLVVDNKGASKKTIEAIDRYQGKFVHH